jgi:hypothetical protein
MRKRKGNPKLRRRVHRTSLLRRAAQNGECSFAHAYRPVTVRESVAADLCRQPARPLVLVLP